MSQVSFRRAFEALTSRLPFPWQEDLYDRFARSEFPTTASLPTGLGKTFVIAVWLIALANHGGKIPRRLVYIVNRRTVVDQATREVEKIRDRLDSAGLTGPLNELCAEQHVVPLAISTLRGQFADNREWSRDPARPAVIVGTVDMIGSRLLFSGYGGGFKTRPLFAGFLGQDSLIVHDEAHLEPAFQRLLSAIECEQHGGRITANGRCELAGPPRDLRPIRVLELTATPRAGAKSFGLTEAEAEPPKTLPKELTEPIHYAWLRLTAKKGLKFHPVGEKETVGKVAELALSHKDGGKAILVFVRTVDAVQEVKGALIGKGRIPSENVEVLTGTIRGWERDRLVNTPVFQRLVPDPTGPKAEGTMYLVCTAAGEVGVDISADHLVCDLTPFDSMAQRFGRVNRYGTSDAQIDIVHETTPNEKKKDDRFDQQRWKTLPLLQKLPVRGDGRFDASPLALGILDPKEREEAFSPQPRIPLTSDILFDSWALTTVREELPGRPPVADWLHGEPEEWDPPETYVAWREDVQLLARSGLSNRQLSELLDDYPLKPHELLRDVTYRVRERLDEIAVGHEDQPVWLVAPDDAVQAKTLGELVERKPSGKKTDFVVAIENQTIVLPTTVGGLTANGMLGPDDPSTQLDVADELRDEDSRPFRKRLTVAADEEPDRDGMRIVVAVPLRPLSEDESAGGEDSEETDGSVAQVRYFLVRPRAADDDGTKSANEEQELTEHLERAEEAAEALARKSGLDERLVRIVALAARWHDLGKARKVWQKSIGNMRFPEGKTLAKSGRTGPLRELSNYRHEFGSLLDAAAKAQFEKLPEQDQDLVLHLIAAHHGRARPHYPAAEAYDPERPAAAAAAAARQVPWLFARLQRRYGRWGLAYLESLVRAADYLASEPKEDAK